MTRAIAALAYVETTPGATSSSTSLSPTDTTVANRPAVVMMREPGRTSCCTCIAARCRRRCALIITPKITTMTSRKSRLPMPDSCQAVGCGVDDDRWTPRRCYRRSIVEERRCATRARRFDLQVCPGRRCRDPPSRGAGQQTCAYEERLGDLLDGLRLLSDCNGKRGEPHRPTGELAYQRFEYCSVQPVEAQRVDVVNSKG